MILINLLPHREERRKRRKAAFFVGIGMAAIAGVILAGIWYLVVEQLTSSQRDRNGILSGEIRRLETQIKDIATLRAEIEALKSRQKAVEDLQTDRNVPVHLLNELVKQAPEGVYLSSIRQTGQIVSVTGIAQTNERVSEFLRNAANNSTWLEKPELVEIKVTNVQTAAREQKRLFDFSMRLSIKRPQSMDTTPAPTVGLAAPAAANKP